MGHTGRAGGSRATKDSMQGKISSTRSQSGSLERLETHIAHPQTSVNSVTLQIPAGRTTWEGNIGYNGAHVNLKTPPDLTETTFHRAGPRGNLIVPDNIFVDESDDAAPGGFGLSAYATAVNNYLRSIARLAGTNEAPAFSFFWD